MNIIESLKSVPYNEHHMNRYIQLIEVWSEQKVGVKHHILPKSMFPEFKSFLKFPENKILLSHRQHFIAHMILWKAYRNRKMSWAFKTMISISKQKISSKQYETLIKDSSRKGICLTDQHRERISKAHFGKKASEETKKKLSEVQSNRTKEHRKNLGLAHKGKVVSMETRKRQSKSLSGEKNPRALVWTIEFEDGRPTIEIKGLKAWCKKYEKNYSKLFRWAKFNIVDYDRGVRVSRSIP